MKRAKHPMCNRHGKQIYPTQGAAISAALRYSRNQGAPLRVYRDPACGHLHLTKLPRNAPLDGVA